MERASLPGEKIIPVRYRDGKKRRVAGLQKAATSVFGSKASRVEFSFKSRGSPPQTRKSQKSFRNFKLKARKFPAAHECVSVVSAPAGGYPVGGGGPAGVGGGGVAGRAEGH
jgi:hypothetical protein